MAHTLNFVAGFVTLLVILAAALSCEARRMQETTKVASQAVAEVRHGTEGINLLGRCKETSISINQQSTTTAPGTAPAFAVQILNLCDCPVSNLVLNCPNFATPLPVNPDIMKIRPDGTCLMKNGQAIAASEMIAFTYHQSYKQPLSFRSGAFAC